MVGEIAEVEPLHAGRISTKFAPERRANRLGDSGFRARRDQGSNSAFREGVDASIRISADDSQTTAGGLQKDNSKAFLGTRHDEHVGHPVVVDQFVVGNPARKAYMRRQSQMGDQFNETASVPAISYDQIDDLRIGLPHSN